MLWSCLGSFTAMWLMFTPALWPDDPSRSWLAGAVGLVAVVVSLAGVASQRARRVLAGLGVVLGVSNFLLPGSIGHFANFATTAFLLILAGMSPTPEVVVSGEVGDRKIMPGSEPELRRAA